MMNVLGVVALFAVVITKGADALKCKKVVDFATDVNALNVEEEDCTSETKCSRPVFKDDDSYVSDEAWGCKDACKTTNMCVLCSTEYCNTEPLTCKKGASSAAVESLTDKRCPDTVATPQGCIRPKKEYGAWTAGAFGCGATCSSADTCVLCKTENACNDPSKMINGNDGHVCYVYTWKSTVYEKTAAVACKGDDAATKICNKPTIGQTLDGSSVSNTGCGPCADDKTAVCTECPTSSCNNIQECFTDKLNTVSALCLEDKCKRPWLLYGAVYAPDIAFNCGGCTDETKDKTCKECSDKDDCNTKVDGGTSKCFTYKWSTDKFVKGASAVCNIGDNAEVKCNMPKGATKEVGEYSTLTGCGPCKAGEKCEACNKEDCNSAHAMKAATAFLLVLLYTMF